MKISRREAAHLFAAAALMPRTLATAQTEEFDVTSVKPSRQDAGWSGVDTSPGRIQADSVTLKRCIMSAYDIGTHAVIGGPAWMTTDRWEIVARAGRPVDDDAVLMRMLQGLLADRFKLAVHRETRSLPAYLLEVGRKGPKMKRSEPGDSDTDMQGGRGSVTLDAKKTGMDALAQIIGRRMDRPVVNHTGLAGGYNFTLHWAPDNGRTPNDDADDMSIFTAVSEQLGLRLHPARAPIEVLVIDHVERPSEN
jgi:uncharacterized protein (TIGR03435 family)